MIIKAAILKNSIIYTGNPYIFFLRFLFKLSVNRKPHQSLQPLIQSLSILSIKAYKNLVKVQQAFSYMPLLVQTRKRASQDFGVIKGKGW